MSTTKFIIRAEILKGMSILAYQSPDRPTLYGVHVEQSANGASVVLVATDGRKLGVIEEGYDLDRCYGTIPSFLIPLPLINRVIPDDWDFTGNPTEVIVSFDGDRVGLGIEGDEIAVTYKLDPKYSKFPDWRGLITEGPPEINPQLGYYQGRYLADFGKASQIMGSGSKGGNSMTATGWGFISEEDRNPSELHIRFTGAPSFFGILKPVRIEGGAEAVASLPDWLAPKPTPATA